MLFFSRGMTPSLIQKPHPPIMLASIMSVVRRSPTTAICDVSVTPVSGCFLKYSMISAPHPGFLTECDSTGMPVAPSTSTACFSLGSQLLAPAVLETMRSLRPGYAFFKASKCAWLCVSEMLTGRDAVSRFKPCSHCGPRLYGDRQSSHPCRGPQP